MNYFRSFIVKVDAGVSLNEILIIRFEISIGNSMTSGGIRQ